MRPGIGVNTNTFKPFASTLILADVGKAWYNNRKKQGLR